MNRALLAGGACAFLVTISGENQAGATFFRTEENLFSRLGELPVRKGLPRAEQSVAVDFKPKLKKWSSRCTDATRRLVVWIKPQCPVWGAERGMETLFPKSKWRKLLISLSIIAATTTLNTSWISALCPTVFFGSQGGEKGDMSVCVANGAMQRGVGCRLSQLGFRAAR